MSNGAPAPQPNDAQRSRASAPAPSSVNPDEGAGATRSGDENDRTPQHSGSGDSTSSGQSGSIGTGRSARRDLPPIWHAGRHRIVLDHPYILGILNVTPDSFSDGGQFTDSRSALLQAERLLREGADMLDVGGESTRPQGAEPVDAEEESARVVPVIVALRREFPDVPISVDTVKAAVADRALEAGADVVNDVSAFRIDPRMAETCAAAGAGVILMHSRGVVSDMATYVHADYGSDVTGEVRRELETALAAAKLAGVPDEAIVLDPGVGFAKRSEHSLAVLAELPVLLELGRPFLVGVSRKRFIGELNEVTIPAERVSGTVGANVLALSRGALLFRVHDVRENREALDVAWAIMQAGAR